MDDYNTSARDIVRAFVKDKEYKVVNYFYPLHSPVASFLWGGLIFSGSFCLAAIITTYIRRK